MNALEAALLAFLFQAVVVPKFHPPRVYDVTAVPTLQTGQLLTRLTVYGG